MITMRLSLIILIFVALSNLHSGCITPSMPSQCASFFSIPADERAKVFAAYSLEEQLVIYRCGMDRRPPDSYLADYIADRGEVAIPELLKKLEQESDELTQVSIIKIFEVMALDGKLRGRDDVLNRLRVVINRMRIQVYKSMASTSLEKMTKFSLKD